MKTGKALNAILADIWDKAGFGEDMEESLAVLRDNISERDGILHGYGEPWNDEADEFNFTALPPVTPDPAPGEDWEGKYNELKSRYISRFFTGGEGDNGESDTNGETTLEQVKADQNEDIKNDDEGKTIDELFS